MALQNFRSYTEMIWYRRLGHFYNEDLKNYLKLHNIIESYCDDCKVSKMRRNPHNNQTPKSSIILEVIHSDIIGPISKSYTGKRFILTIIDEFSRKSWLFLLKGKSETIEYIINALKYLNNLSDNNKIKIFKSDNGREYNNKKIINFCKENGIQKVYCFVEKKKFLKPKCRFELATLFKRSGVVEIIFVI